MGNSTNWRRIFGWLCGSFLIVFLSFLLISGRTSDTTSIHSRRILRAGGLNSSSPQIRLQTDKRHEKVVILDNGVVELTFNNPNGDVIGIKYNGIDNLLEYHNAYTNRGYWDIVWGEGTTGKIANHYEKLQGTKFKIIKQDEEGIEISFSRKWSNSTGALPISVDKRYVMLRDYPGFYTYGIFEHPKEAPAVQIGDLRVAFKLQQEKFQYMAISDEQQRMMPFAKDRTNGEPLAYPEAVLLTNTSNPKFQGEVDDKYQYSMDHKDMKVHGWISSKPGVGFWVITPSHEFLTGGPMKQELTSHVGPVALSMFMSCHYVGKDMIIKLEEGESWKKVFGPTPIYFNSVTNNENHKKSLWENAKKQAEVEAAKWPYDFIRSADLPQANQRGSVTGQLLIRDKYMNESDFEAGYAYVGLAEPGEAGSWQRENKGYQFWVKADKNGSFSIENVRAGNYSLYAFVPGIIGDYAYENIITIEAGSKVELGNLVYEPPRNGPTLWEIGIPDPTASEFYIPDPLPTRVNPLYINKPNDKYRQYGLWDRYTDLYPSHDLVYTVNSSDYRRDWFFAHVNRKVGNNTYQGTTWQVRFNLEEKDVPWGGSYTLRIALASATNTHLQVRLNDQSSRRTVLSTQLIGRDNSIARHGVHGLYRLYSVDVAAELVRRGHNTFYLTHFGTTGPFEGLLYDYIRFEAPPSQS